MIQTEAVERLAAQSGRAALGRCAPKMAAMATPRTRGRRGRRMWGWSGGRCAGVWYSAVIGGEGKMGREGQRTGSEKGAKGVREASERGARWVRKGYVRVARGVHEGYT